MPEKSGPDTARSFTPAELVRIHEANCQIDFASDQEQNFRLATMKALARKMEISELKGAVIIGPGKGVPRPGKGGA